MDSDEERNFICLLLLLMRLTSKLRDFFIRKWNFDIMVDVHSYNHLKLPPRTRRTWSDCPQDGADLLRIHKPLLLPYELPKVASGNTSIWDLPLIVKILLKICVYKTRPEPPERKALKKLKEIRNNLCHSCDAKLTNYDFQRMWNDACNAFVIFGATLEDFESVKRDAKQPLKDLKPVVMKWLAPTLKLLDTGQLKLSQKLEKVEEGQLTLRHEIQQSQRLIQDEICELKETVQATAGTTRPSPATLIIMIGWLSNYLKDHYRRGESALLLPSSSMAGDQFRIGNIYTLPKIVEMNTYHVIPLKEIFSTTIEMLTSFNVRRRILIEGEPGIGKSAICKKIAYDWSMDKNPQLFPTFEVVLSLRCRELHASSNLWDAVEKQNLSDCLTKRRKDVFEYIENNQHKVLLILDGYDEIPDKSADSMKQSIERLIRGQLLPFSYVIVTSRPGKGSEIRNHFDRKLEIKGFELNDSFTFIRRFFASAELEKSLLSISFIKSREDAKDLVRNPLITAILCRFVHMHPEKKNESHIPDTLYREIVFSLFKRHRSEKFNKEIKEDDRTEFDSIIYSHGKLAFNLIKENHFGINENEFPVVSAGTASPQFKAMGFLVNRKLPNQIGPESSYNFSHNSIKEFLATCYVEISFKSLNGKEIISIMTFRDFASFSRNLKFLYHHIKFKTCIEILVRFICFIWRCFLSSICIAIKMISTVIKARA